MDHRNVTLLSFFSLFRQCNTLLKHGFQYTVSFVLGRFYLFVVIDTA